MYFLRRLIYAVPLLLVFSAITFGLAHLAPGGPFDRERKPASPEIERNIRAKYHLDEPVWEQYGRYLGGLLHGDFGPSLKYRNHSVTDIIAQGLPVSMTLGGIAFCFALAVGLPAGFLTAARRGRWPDYLGSFLAVLAVCIPSFVLAPGLILGLAILVPAASSSWAQNQYIGYVYPAGGQQDTTFPIRLGGQGLDYASDVVVSGEGEDRFTESQAPLRDEADEDIWEEYQSLLSRCLPELLLCPDPLPWPPSSLVPECLWASPRLQSCAARLLPAVEAALAARKVPPVMANPELKPRTYSFQKWPSFDPDEWTKTVTSLGERSFPGPK